MENINTTEVQPQEPVAPIEQEPQIQSQEDMFRSMSQSIQDETREYEEAKLKDDPTYMFAARRYHKRIHGKDFEGTDEELVSKSQDDIRFILDNDVGMAHTIMNLDNLTEEQALTTYYLVDATNKKDTTMAGVGRFLQATALSPTSYIGLHAFKFAGGKATREVLLDRLKKRFLTAGNIAALEGGIYGTYFAHGEESIKEAAGYGYDKGTVATTGVAGATIGKGIGEGAEWLSDKLVKTANKGNELMAQQAGGGSPFIPTEKVDAMLAEATNLEGGSLNRHLAKIDMRRLSPEDKQKVIEFRKSNIKTKPKTPKQEEQIAAKDLWRSGFYSKLEDVIAKMPETTFFKDKASVENYLKTQGVKEDEIRHSGILERHTDEYNKESLGDILGTRRDTIEKRSVVEMSESSEPLEFDDWDSEVSVEQIDRASIGEPGVGWRVEDYQTGRTIDIRLSYDYDYYVDDYGEVFEYHDMLDDWFDNYADVDEYMPRLIEDKVDLEDDDAIRKAVLEYAEDDQPWYDYYGNREIFETEYGTTHYSQEEAVEHAKEIMYRDYEDELSEYGQETYSGYTVEGGENYDMELYRMPDYMATEPGKSRHVEPHLSGGYEDEAESVAFHVRKKDRTDAEGNSGVVLEEVQSQWEQDWRASGGDTEITGAEATKVESRIRELDKEMGDFSESANDASSKRMDLVNERNAIHDEIVARNETRPTDEESAKLKDLDSEINYLSDKISKSRLKIRELRTAQEREKSKLKTSTIGTPPLSKRTQYQKLALMDQLKKAVDEDKNFFGFINGHIQNGSRIDTTKGMIQAYDVEMPRIIQKLTGLKPYMADFKTGKPIAGEDGKKVFWEAKKAAEGEHFDNIADKGYWYWKIDLTPELKDKLKKAKIQMYSVPAATIGVGAATQQEEETE